MTSTNTETCRRNCRAYGNRVEGCPVCESARQAFRLGVSQALAMWAAGSTTEEIEASANPGRKATAGALLGCTGDFERAATASGLTHEQAWDLLDAIKATA